MNQQWIIDLEKAQIGIELIKNEVFQNKIELVSTENKDTLICKWLDKNAGIDLIGKKNDNLISMACRIQWSINYRTFTIRYKRKSGAKTEYEKRIEAIKKDYIYPGWTLQAYIDGKFDIYNKLTNGNSLKILGCALVKTKPLYEYIENNINNIHYNTANYENNEFIYVYWNDVKHLDGFWRYSKNEKKYFAPKQTKISF